MFTQGPDKNVALSSTESQGTSHLWTSPLDDTPIGIHWGSLASSTHLSSLTVVDGKRRLLARGKIMWFFWARIRLSVRGHDFPLAVPVSVTWALPPAATTCPTRASTPSLPHSSPGWSNPGLQKDQMLPLVFLTRTFHLFLYLHSISWSYLPFKRDQNLKLEWWSSDGGISDTGGQIEEVCVQWEGRCWGLSGRPSVHHLPEGDEID